MPPWHFFVIIIFLCPSRADAPVNVDDAPGYPRLRYCAQRGLDLGIATLGCSTNDCLCRVDIFASAITAISTSAVSYCSGNTVDATAAMGLFISYCTVNGYTAPAAAASIVVPTPAGNIQSVNMYSAQFYNQLRYCAQRGVDLGVSAVGCNTNDCLCRIDILASAVTAISSSASSACYGNTIDITSAMGMFITYCTANGYSAPSSIATISVPSPAGNTDTMTIDYSPAYSALRYCAQRGLDQGINSYSCDTNDCLCRRDILSSAMTAISTQVDGYCSSASADASSAISVAVNYCYLNAYTAISFGIPPTPTGSSPSGSHTLSPGASSALATATSSGTSTPQSNSSDAVHIVPIVVGVVFTVVVLWWCWRHCRPKPPTPFNLGSPSHNGPISGSYDQVPLTSCGQVITQPGPNAMLGGGVGMSASHSNFNQVAGNQYNITVEAARRNSHRG